MAGKNPSLRRARSSQTLPVPTSKSIGPADIHAAIARLAEGIAGRHRDAKSTLLLLGVANGGIELARRLAAALAAKQPAVPARAGVLDISFHRDDIGRHPIPKEFEPTQIPADVNGAIIVLVDDVLFSGRTAKAALDEIFDHGRPTKVELAVLVDRAGRRLPFAADYAGLTLAPGVDEKVVVTLDAKNPRRDAIQIAPASAAVRESSL